MKGSISVVIPAYNRAGLIGETLRSLLKQTVSAKEIIIVDDGSTDGTAQAVLEMLKLGEAEKLKISGGKPWPEFKLIRQENRGLGPARNRGLAEARGEFIHFFDSDDLAMPTKHEVQLAALEKSGADIVFSPWICFRDKNGEVTLEDWVLQGELPDSKFPLWTWFLRGWGVLLQTMLFRASFLRNVGDLGDDMPTHQDEAFFSKILALSPNIVHVGGIGLVYRIHENGNLTARGDLPSLSRTIDRAKFLLFVNKILPKPPDALTWSKRKILLYKVWCDFRVLNKVNHEAARSLLSSIAPAPLWICALFSFCDRIYTRVRLAFTGTRIKSYSQPKKLGSSEKIKIIELIKNTN